MELNFYMSPSLIYSFGAWILALVIKSLIEYFTG
jgi:hypothetical protein